MKQFHSDWLCRKNLEKMICRDTVFGHKSFEDMKAFRSQHIDSPIFERAGHNIRGILYKVTIHEVLANAFGHLTRHWKCCSCRGGDDTSRIFRIGGPRWLGEFESGEIGTGVISLVLSTFISRSWGQTHVVKLLGYVLKKFRWVSKFILTTKVQNRSWASWYYLISATTILNEMATDLDKWSTASGGLHKMWIDSAGHDDQGTDSSK